jgi:hypothetical protein
MAKKINLTNLKSMEKEVFSTKEVIIGDYSINIDIKFRETKIINLLKEFLEKANYAKENNIDLDFSTYGLVLLIKYFTDIDMPNDYDKEMQVYNILVDLGILSIILENFDEEEIKKFNEKLNLYNQNITKLAEELKDKKV